VALGLQLGAPVLLDENRGRRVALAAHLAVIGTLGVLVLAKRHGILARVQPQVARLQDEGFRMSPGLVAEALRMAGEA
jgi:predicted nucleic acid-binding protein